MAGRPAAARPGPWRGRPAAGSRAPSKRVRQRLGGALQHQHVAGLEPDLAQARRDPLPAACDGQEVHAVDLAQPQFLGRASDQDGVRHDHGLDHADAAGGQVLGRTIPDAGEPQPRLRDDLPQGMRIAPEHQQVVREERPVPGRDIPVVALADDRDHRHLALAARLQLRDGLADQPRAPGQARFGQVRFDLEGGRGRRLGAARRREAVASRRPGTPARRRRPRAPRG